MVDTLEIARHFGISRRTVLRRIQAGIFPADRRPQVQPGKRGRGRGATDYRLDIAACEAALQHAGEPRL